MTPKTTPAYTWQGKGLRLIDLLDQEERKAVLGVFPSERQFRAQHITGDATAFMKYAADNALLEDADDVVTRQVWESTLEGMGWHVATAMDGRMEVTKIDSVAPLRGSIAPGSRTESQVAHDYIMGLAAQCQHPKFPVTQRSQRMVFVSKDFAEYLRATGETVQAFEKDRDGDVAFVWPARHDQQVDRVLRSFHLATLGANEPSGGELARVAELKTPKQFAIWKAGLGDQWRMMDALREVLHGAAQTMTSGAYADKLGGGGLSAALTSFQRAFGFIAEDAAQGIPSTRAVQELSGVCDNVASVASFLDNKSPVRESAIHESLINSIDLAATIGRDLQSMHEQYVRDQAREPAKGLDASHGLG